MSAKPGITIVGAGNLASALAISLCRAGYRIDRVIARSSGGSLRKASRLAREVRTVAAVSLPARADSEVIWFCVPDREIANAARALADGKIWKAKVALHSSGALSSAELDALKRQGAKTASVHPMMTFVAGSRASLAGVPFAIEGDAAAVRVARRIVNDLRGQPFVIRKKDKATYHAWGTFASPLFVILLSAAEKVALASGTKPASARKRMLPMVAQTVANYAALSAAGAFSGPFARGDVETIRMHLRALSSLPEAREVYVALGKAALKYLPTRNRRALADVLKR